MIKNFKQFLNESKGSDTEKIHDYILNSIDADNYDASVETDKEKLQFLADTFKAEYQYPSKLNVTGFEDWIRGLPSCFNVEHDYATILNIAYLFNLIKVNADEEDEDLLVQNWFKIISKEVFQMFDEYKIELKSK